MKSNYQKYAEELFKDKKYYDLNCFIANNASEIINGKLKITKAIANKITMEHLVKIGCKCRSALKMIPEYKTTDFRGLLVDWLLDMKLDREYKKPTMKEIFLVFPVFVSNDLAMSCVLLMEEMGITKEEFIKSYTLDGYKWLNMYRCLKGSKIKVTDKDLRDLDKTYMRKHKAHNVNLLMNLSKWTDEEAKFLIISDGNHQPYAQRQFVSKHLNKISPQILLLHLFKCHDEYNHHAHCYNPQLRDLFNRIATDMSLKAGTLAQGLYPECEWLWKENTKLINPEYHDDTLDIALDLLPDSHKYKMLAQAYNITFKDVVEEI